MNRFEIPETLCRICRHYNRHTCNLDDLETCRFVRDEKKVSDERAKSILLAGVVIFALILSILAIIVSCSARKEQPKPEYHWSTIELLKEYYGEPEPALTDFDKLTLAIALTESRFQPDAVGKDDDLGILQIRPVFVEEANRVSGSNFRHEDAFDIDSSLAMFNAVQGHYNAEHDLEKAIRLHNKADWYRAKVLENYDLICRMEIVRAKLTSK